MSKNPDKCDTESPRKKVEAVASFPDDPRIIRNVRQSLYRRLLSEQIEMRAKGTLRMSLPIVRPGRWPSPQFGIRSDSPAAGVKCSRPIIESRFRSSYIHRYIHTKKFVVRSRR